MTTHLCNDTVVRIFIATGTTKGPVVYAFHGSFENIEGATKKRACILDDPLGLHDFMIDCGNRTVTRLNFVRVSFPITKTDHRRFVISREQARHILNTCFPRVDAPKSFPLDVKGAFLDLSMVTVESESVFESEFDRHFGK